MQVPEMFAGDSRTRLIQGTLFGIVLTMAVGFSWFGYGFGWKLGGTVEGIAAARAEAAVVTTYAPVCVKDFVREATTANWDAYKEEKNWNRDNYLIKAGYATPPGQASPNRQVAGDCAEALNKVLEARASN
jgi:hypothetical protein